MVKSPVWFSAAFAVVGFVVAVRKPRNPLGWIMLAVGGFFALSEDASFYVVASYRLRPGGLALGWLASVTAQALSFRRASGERRQQLKWLLAGSVLAGASIAAAVGHPFGHSGFGRILAAVGFVGILAIPGCLGVAVLKYRLYDIDRIVSRTLAYAIVTGLLVGVYAGLVLLATGVLRLHSTVAVAAATLAAAALFAPARRRVQRAVDHRFNRARYDADQTVTAFAARLKGAVDLDAVRGDLARVVQASLEPAHISVWIKPD